MEFDGDEPILVFFSEVIHLFLFVYKVCQP